MNKIIVLTFFCASFSLTASDKDINFRIFFPHAQSVSAEHDVTRMFPLQERYECKRLKNPSPDVAASYMAWLAEWKKMNAAFQNTQASPEKNLK